MDNLIVILIVAIACAYMFRRFYRSTKKDAGCGCARECSEKDSPPCAPDGMEAPKIGASEHKP